VQNDIKNISTLLFEVLLVSKIFKEFQGQTIRINGVCYTYTGETLDTPNSDPSEIESTFGSCLECELVSTSSTSSESMANLSSESSSQSDFVDIGECTSPCDLTVQFRTFTIPDRLEVYDANGLQLDTGDISTGLSFNTYNFSQLECPITVCVYAPSAGTAWDIKINGCGMNVQERGGQVVQKCYESPALQSSSSSQSMSSESSSSLSFSSESSSSEPMGDVSSSSSSPGAVPSSCPGSNPEMLITVTGASGSVTWCGETWNLPADSGDQRTVCPTSYSIFQGTGGSYTNGTRVARHRWTHNNDLRMQRLYSNQLPYGGFYLRQRHRLNGLFGGASLQADERYHYQTSGGFTSMSDSVGNLTNGLTIGSAMITYSDYQLGGNFFGSETVGGNTFSWVKGNGWPT